MRGVRNKYCLKSTGMIMTLVNIAFIIVELFLCGYQFRQTHQNWTSNGEYRVLGILQLSAVIFIFVSIVMGFLLFSWLSESKGAHCVVCSIFYSFYLVYFGKWFINATYLSYITFYVNSRIHWEY